MVVLETLCVDLTRVSEVGQACGQYIQTQSNAKMLQKTILNAKVVEEELTTALIKILLNDTRR